MTPLNCLVLLFISLGVAFTYVELAADCRDKGGVFSSWQCTGMVAR